MYQETINKVKDAIENVGQTISSSLEGCFGLDDTNQIIKVRWLLL